MTMLVRTKSRPFELTEVTAGELVDLIRWDNLLTSLAYLYVNWFTYPSGPAVNVSNLTLTITKQGAGSPIFGPSAVGIENIGIGIYRFAWSEAYRSGPGNYDLVWSAIDETATPIQALETVTLT